MNEQWTIVISPDAKQEVRAIYKYIAYTLLAPDAAKRQINRILDGMNSLYSMPMRYSLYEHEPWRSRGLRKLVVDNYIVLYLTNEQAKEVIILHTFYGGRNIDALIN